MSAATGKDIVPGVEAPPTASGALHMVSSSGDDCVWRFVEPFLNPRQLTCSTSLQAQVVVHLSASAKLSPLKAYMYFANIKDTSGSKAAQFKKYYTTEDRFLKVFNERFGTCHSLGALRGMMRTAKEERLKLKRQDAMSVKILQLLPFTGW